MEKHIKNWNHFKALNEAKKAEATENTESKLDEASSADQIKSLNDKLSKQHDILTQIANAIDDAIKDGDKADAKKLKAKGDLVALKMDLLRAQIKFAKEFGNDSEVSESEVVVEISEKDSEEQIGITYLDFIEDGMSKADAIEKTAKTMKVGANEVKTIVAALTEAFEVYMAENSDISSLNEGDDKADKIQDQISKTKKKLEEFQSRYSDAKQPLQKKIIKINIDIEKSFLVYLGHKLALSHLV